MKKFVLLLVLIFAGYKLHQNGYFKRDTAAAVGADGKPVVVLFVGPGCGAHCDSVRAHLNKRGVKFEEIDIAGPDGAPVDNKYGINSYPTTLIGKQQILGTDLVDITGALAENFGKKILTRGERLAIDGHFDKQGMAKTVMYATNWCGYCKKQREYFAANNIEFEEINVEGSDFNQLMYNALEGSGYPLTYVGFRRFSGYNEGPLLNAVAEVSKLPPVSE
jgi:glutaredoxin